MKNWEVSRDTCLGECKVFQLIEAAFLCFYILELLLKLSVHHGYFFCNKEMYWNLFDFALVVIAAQDFFVLYLHSGGGTPANKTFLRTLRILKMAKALRVLRVLRFFAKLRLILRSIVGSCLSLLWSIITLFFIIYIFSLIFVQGVSTWLIEHGAHLSPEQVQDITKAFGSVELTMVNLFKAITGGIDWQEIYDVVKPGGYMHAVFIFFIAFINIALMNVLTGIFVESAMKMAMPDRESLAIEKQIEEQHDREELAGLFQDMDINGDGRISTAEFTKHLLSEQSGGLKPRLALLGLDIKDTKKFFESMAATCGGVDELEFVNGCMHLKGVATSLELNHLMVKLQNIAQLQQRIIDRRSVQRHSGLMAEQCEQTTFSLSL